MIGLPVRLEIERIEKYRHERSTDSYTGAIFGSTPYLAPVLTGLFLHGDGELPWNG